ncbi:mycofactocin precursor MftA [Listeria monocytogenes]|nr:mycofactocin precursor MftA [Listeria monocytogenes]MDV7237589.1 mycofactocin precursor MftA [Listeria monocytogenes]
MENVNPNLETETVEGAGLVIEDLVEDVSIDGMCGVY